MALASQPYFSHALGRNNPALLKSFLSVNILIYGGIALFALLALESVGLWFVNQHLNVPSGRLDSVVTVFRLAAFALFANILTSPFNAMIIAHVDMQLYAYLPGDKIIIYGMLVQMLPVCLVVSMTLLPVAFILW